MDELRVLIVDLSRRFGGSNARVLGLLNHFSEVQASLAALKGSQLHRQAKDLGFKVHAIARTKCDPRIPFVLRKIIRKNGIQVLDVQNPQSKFWCSFFCRDTGAAVVSTLNSWYETEYAGSLKGRMYQALESLTDQRTDLFIAVSSDIEKRLLRRYVSQEAIRTIPNAVSVASISASPARKWLHERFSLPENAKVCTAIGRLVGAKGHDALIKAVAGSREPDLCCLVIGEGPLSGELRESIRRHSLQGKVKLVGFQEHAQAMRILASSDLFVMPSRSEGTPIALLEAAALGIPIIASRVGGIPHLLANKAEALLVPPGDERQLEEAIDSLLSDQGRANRMARAARNRVVSDFSPHAQQEATQRAYALACKRFELGLGTRDGRSDERGLRRS